MDFSKGPRPVAPLALSGIVPLARLSNPFRLGVLARLLCCLALSWGLRLGSHRRSRRLAPCLEKSFKLMPYYLALEMVLGLNDGGELRLRTRCVAGA
jgi:hypothetical protein